MFALHLIAYQFIREYVVHNVSIALKLYYSLQLAN